MSEWKSFTEPRPYVTVSGIAIDGMGRFVLLHRSANVRSARDCWSLPSGLHEVGLTLNQQFATELKEELNLEAFPNMAEVIGHYENIRPDGPDVPGWHWVIFVMVMRVKSLDTLVNSEPDKHDVMETTHYLEPWIEGRKWAPKLGEFLVANRRQLEAACARVSTIPV